ncbi:hypothetical protein PG997_013612 [Apiospora hydei]|uniref:Uncharacterized protein n=1 Tax=Apiospora hydei TaxID=1337664 RepID=A0ABR1V6P1_9PEZI
MPLSACEYQRLSRALIRYQILIRLYPEGERYANEDPLKLQDGHYLGLFEAWEVEQISAAYTWVSCVIYMLEDADWSSPRGHVPVHIIFSYTCGKFYTNYKWLDLDGLGALGYTIEEVATPGAKFADMLKAYQSKYGYWRNDGYYCDGYTLDGGQVFSDGALPDIYAYGVSKEDTVKAMKTVYQSVKDRPHLSAGASVEEPPFGWVDAMRGLDCCRWGLYLEMCYYCVAQHRCPCRAYKELVRWRRLGFVFWDKDRIQLLQQHYDTLRTGWLGDPWD